MSTGRQQRRAEQLALLAGLLLGSVGGSAAAHEGGLGNEAMWNACEARAVDDGCSFRNHDLDLFRGTCQSMANALVCVRNQPIERAVAPSHTHQAGRQSAAVRLTTREWFGIGSCVVLLAGGLALFDIGRRSARR